MGVRVVMFVNCISNVESQSNSKYFNWQGRWDIYVVNKGK